MFDIRDFISIAKKSTHKKSMLKAFIHAKEEELKQYPKKEKEIREEIRIIEFELADGKGFCDKTIIEMLKKEIKYLEEQNKILEANVDHISRVFKSYITRPDEEY